LLTLFVRNGGVVVLDEVNACPSDILFCLHSLTDDERTLTLLDKDSEVLHAHPNFFLITTFNPDYEGTKPLNEAFKDRFKVKLDFDYNLKIEDKLVEDKDILRLAEKLRIMRAKNEISTPISTRMLIFYEQNSKQYGKDLALEFFLNNFESYEKEPIKNVLEMISKGEDVNATQNTQTQTITP
jgi:MoxR-like ATPase